MAFVLIRLIIWTIVVLIVATFVAVLARRTYMTRKYRLLDRARQRCLPLSSALSSRGAARDIAAYRARPGSHLWVAVEELLFKSLESSDDAGEAVRLLGELGYPRYYLKVLRAGRPRERALAAERLGRMRTAEAVPHLIEALGSTNRDLKLMAINSLGLIRDGSAIPHLIRTLKHVLSRDEETSIRVLKSSIIFFGQEALRDLLVELRAPEWRVRSTVLDILCEIGDRGAAAEFTRLLEDPEQEVRAKAAKGLGRLRHAEAASALARSLGDQHWVVRLHSARALGLIRDEQAIPDLRNALSDRHWQVRQEAADALARVGGRGYMALLAAYIENIDQFAREQVMDELGSAGLYGSLCALLGGGPLPGLKHGHGHDEKEEISEPVLREMAGILSTLTEDALVEMAGRLSSGSEGEMDAALFAQMLKAGLRHPGGEAARD